MLRRKRRLTGLVASALVLGLACASASMAQAGRARAAGADPPTAAAKALEIFYTPPVLARAGEPVRIPVDVVCSTDAGRACPATVSMGSLDAAGRWQLTTAPASAQLQFDLSAPATRALAGSSSGSASFFLQASGGGRTLSMPAAGSRSPLHFYVVRSMPTVTVPAIPFGAVHTAQTVLELPWGSGPGNAGIELGREAATLGPSAFDVDRAGRILLLDGLNGRLAVFSQGKLMRSARIGLIPRGDVAAMQDGGAEVAHSTTSGVEVQRVEPTGEVAAPINVGAGILSQITAAQGKAFVNVLPEDTWVSAQDSSGAAVRTVARPLSPDGSAGLLRVASETRVRLGLLKGGSVHGAVELRPDPSSGQRFGEISLAEPDGRGGYWAVIHMWREAPTPADQYQVVHVRLGRVTQTFAAPAHQFAQCAPLSRYRLGKDGSLYQLATFPSGMRILRYDLGRES